MQDPLKQGLKLAGFADVVYKEGIRMQDPLKQGLKLKKGCLISRITKDSNARSTKTRIETHVRKRVFLQRFCIRMQDPLKQGLKLPRVLETG